MLICRCKSCGRATPSISTQLWTWIRAELMVSMVTSFEERAFVCEICVRPRYTYDKQIGEFIPKLAFLSIAPSDRPSRFQVLVFSIICLVALMLLLVAAFDPYEHGTVSRLTFIVTAVVEVCAATTVAKRMLRG